jgi:DNA-binding CsgD family transcriptional regulator/PAS domain-containing protein
MDRNPRALDLIGRIYDAAAGPALWQNVVEGLSEALAGSAVALSFELPAVPPSDLRFVAGIDAEIGRDCVDAFLAEIPRAAAERSPFARGFACALPSTDRAIESSASSESSRKLGQLATARPMGHLIAIEDGRPIASIVAYRKDGAGAFSEDDLAFANRLVPHLARAFDLNRGLVSVTRRRRALAEVMNRLPTGVILLNDEGRAVFANRSATRILDRNDGVFVADDALHVSDVRTDEALQRHIADAITSRLPDAGEEPVERRIGGTVGATRTAGAGAYTVSVSRLLPGSSIHDAVASVLLSDPEIGAEPAVELLRELHDLTPAEADLMGQLARGRSLAEAARARGASISTARSQLKQVFFKTGTSRQGELVQLVLRCVIPVADE